MSPKISGQWPPLPLNEWEDTCLSLHLWLQVVGKIKLVLTRRSNHWWNTALHVYSEGLTTGIIHHAMRCFQIDLDLTRHRLLIHTEDGEEEVIALRSQSVAQFYSGLISRLENLDIKVRIWTEPVEMQYKVHFEKDDLVREYKPEYANRFWKILAETDRVMKDFRCGFTGKSSPANFYWGGMDLAITFFSGRIAPPHPGVPNVGRDVMLEAYSHEVSSMGFWPGEGYGEAAFYAYAYPEPEGYKDWPIEPGGAFYHPELREFILPYEAVRLSGNPSERVLSFFRSAHEAGRILSEWNSELYREEYSTVLA